MCINFNVYNCIRNTKVYVYIKIYRETERERESMGTCFVFAIHTVLYLYIYLFGDRVELHMYTHAVLYSILTCTTQIYIFSYQM